ncbi:MAG: N-acetylglucosamine-6-phosphate deacetylase [Lachnospiraceae bacterium]
MLIRDGKVFAGGQFQEKDMRIENGRISEIAGRGELTLQDGEELLELNGRMLLPGLVDVHSHGRAGEDFNFADLAGLKKLCDSYASCGVTSVLGTTMTNEPSAIARAMERIGAYRSEQHSGAHLLGIHMEGPFLGKDKKGAHDERYLRPIDRDWFTEMNRLSGDCIRIVSLDPRLSGAAGFMKECRERGIVVSLAHTGCDYETAKLASEAGANHVTHLFNAMNPLHHRMPGLIGAAFDCDMYTELICDGIHLHETIIRMMFAMRPERQLLISDSMQAAGLPDGTYSLGGLDVFVKDGKATLADGTIAGSTTNVYAAMVQAIRFGIPAEQAILSASYLPAKSIGMENEIGSIAVGRNADLLVVDESWTLKNIYIKGVLYK